jgi:hypothetical protein
VIGSLLLVLVFFELVTSSSGPFEKCPGRIVTASSTSKDLPFQIRQRLAVVALTVALFVVLASNAGPGSAEQRPRHESPVRLAKHSNAVHWISSDAVRAFAPLLEGQHVYDEVKDSQATTRSGTHKSAETTVGSGFSSARPASEIAQFRYDMGQLLRVSHVVVATKPGAMAEGPYSGAASAKVPNLNGLTQAEAEAALREAGFTGRAPTKGGITEFRAPDGSKVYIKADGEVTRVVPVDEGPKVKNTTRRVDTDGNQVGHSTGERIKK